MRAMVALLLAVPFVFSISPSSATAGAAGASVYVTGQGFSPQSVGLWNGQPRATVYVSSAELRVELRPSDVIAAEPGFVSVYDRGSRAASAAARFDVAAPPLRDPALARRHAPVPSCDQSPLPAPAATPAVYEPESSARSKPLKRAPAAGKTSL